MITANRNQSEAVTAGNVSAQTPPFLSILEFFFLRHHVIALSLFLITEGHDIQQRVILFA